MIALIQNLNLVFLLTSLGVFALGLYFAFKKGKAASLPAFAMFWAIALVQMILLSIDLYHEINSEAMGHGDQILYPLGGMLAVVLYASCLSLLASILLSAFRFERNVIWIEIMIILISCSSIAMSGSIYYLVISILNGNSQQ